MVKRHAKSKFMAGLYVYPGGQVDDRDCNAESESMCYGLDAKGAAQILGGDLAPERALGHFVAAIRETLEEAGVLLATRDNGEMATLTPDALSGYRSALQTGDTSMSQVMQSLNLKLDLGRLRYFAHWVTPPSEPRRFTARFFLCPVSAEQQAEFDAVETTDGLWLVPKDALERYAMGKFQTAPPTLRLLEQMAEFDSVEAALAAAPHCPVEPNAPCFADDAGVKSLVLPGDPLHPEEPGDAKHRFELRDGRWWSYF
jgi:8-oxo-dGTP pyrophosphatase MutT (NUDIX family)